MTERMFTFTYFLDNSDGSQAWIASCDELHTTTEAATYEALIERVWQIGPEMAIELGFVGNGNDVRLRFVAEMNAPGQFVTAS